MNQANLPAFASTFASAPGTMLGAMLDQSTDCIKIIGLDGTVDYMNRNGQCAMEVDDFCAIAGQPWTSLWPDEARPAITEALDDARAGRSARFEAYCPTARGTPRWWDVSVSPLRREDGMVQGFISTSRDVSERVKARDAKDAIGAELRHRLRNHFAVVGSLLSAHARGRPEQDEFVRDMLARYGALAVAQTMEAEEGSRQLLGDLLPALLNAYQTPACTISIADAPEISLDHGQIEALSLVCGELAVNSTKHGALAGGGEIKIDVTVKDDRFTIGWRERSVRAVEAQTRDDGQGMRLMIRVLAARNGTLDIDWRGDGLDATVAMPILRSV